MEDPQEVIGQARPDTCTQPREITVRDERYVIACGMRTCEVCGARWEKDQRVNAAANSEQLRGAVALITVTAPGVWHFSHSGRVDQEHYIQRVAAWNLGARRAWRDLHLAASKMPRRQDRRHFGDWRVLYRSWEYQKRGLLHVHLVLPFGTNRDRITTRAYVRNLHRLARDHHFGYVLGGDSSERPTWRRPPRVVSASAKDAARYVAKYVASIGSGKDSMSSVAKRTAKRGSILYISRTLTSQSGVTMTSLRARRRVASRYPWGKASRAAWRAACACDGVQRRRSPLTPDGEARLRAHLLSTQQGFVWDADTEEAIPPTLAPMPLGLRDDPEPTPPPGRAGAIRLAPVRLRDPTRPELGSWRTQVTVIGAS